MIHSTWGPRLDCLNEEALLQIVFDYIEASGDQFINLKRSRNKVEIRRSLRLVAN